jgi:hypothetical protein
VRTTGNGSEWTNPGASDPFPQWGRADPVIQIDPMILDLVDPGVHLCIARLLGELAVRTT